MDSLVSCAIRELQLSNASFDLQLPFLSDDAWDSAFSCTQRELDTRRSGALLALYSFLEPHLLRAASRQNSPLDLDLLREVIFSDDVLACFLVNAGVIDSYAGRGNKQASNAFLVFVEMVVMDRGVPEFMSWFYRAFGPILSVAFEVCSTCQPAAAGKTPSKRTLLSDDAGDSKRRRVGMDTSEPKRPDSTLAVLRRLRQRQMLLASTQFTSDILIQLGPQRSVLTGPNMERILAKEMALNQVDQESPPLVQSVTRAHARTRRAPSGANQHSKPRLCSSETQSHNIAPMSGEEKPTPFAIHAVKSEPTSHISTVPPCDAAVSIEPLVLPETSQDRDISSIRAQSSTIPPTETSHAPACYFVQFLFDPAILQGLEQEAVLFINETIEMVKRGELLPTPILRAGGGISADSTIINNTSSRPQTQPNPKKKPQNKVTKENLKPVSSKKAKWCVLLWL
ncbi:hypothetical protein FB451DRAFT_1245333 [Mycena latifolia]|nr:hypothetical protein FB451DRAFT_1245333 [Mycena latifolia]